MKAVTIDNLDIKDHVRWAQDQQTYDVSLVSEASIVAPHPEIGGMSLIYPSKFEELFELQKRNLPWACFSQPKNFHLFGKRFFSYRLFPSIYWNDESDSQEDKGKEDEEADEEDLIQMIIKAPKLPHLSHSLFEKDKSSILNLLQEIKTIDRMLRLINARKLQYQKG